MPSPAAHRRPTTQAVLTLGFAAAMLCTGGGCEALRKAPNIPNPVVGPPPPRTGVDAAIAADDARLAEQAAAKQKALARAEQVAAEAGPLVTAAGTRADNPFAAAESNPFAAVEIEQASATGPSRVIGPNDPLDDSTIVATVNAEPVLAGEVFEPFRGKLNEIKAAEGSTLPNGQFVPAGSSEQFKREILKRRLDDFIERTVLAQAGEQSLAPEQAEQIDEAMAAAWSDEVEKMMGRAEVETRAELAEEMRKQGQSLGGLEAMFRKQQMAGLWASQNQPPSRPVGRQELLDYYNTHLDEFSHEARARWQQLEISIPKSGGRDAAIDRLSAAVEDLKRGDAFGDVVRKHSDGERAHRGGQHDWTKPGELDNAEIGDALFAAPVGRVTKVFEEPDAFRVVRVTERDEPGRIPLEKVQDQIRAKILADRQQAHRETLLTDVMAEAVIEKFFR